MIKILITDAISLAAGFILATYFNKNSVSIQKPDIIGKEALSYPKKQNSNEKTSLATVTNEIFIEQKSKEPIKKKIFTDEKGEKLELVLNEGIERGLVLSETSGPSGGRYIDR